VGIEAVVFGGQPDSVGNPLEVRRGDYFRFSESGQQRTAWNRNATAEDSVKMSESVKLLGGSPAFQYTILGRYGEIPLLLGLLPPQ